MFDKLEKHHIGIIIPENQCDHLAKKYKKSFIKDNIQGTRVMFAYDEDFGFYREYIVKEGRVKNLPLGFAHICYSLESRVQFDKVESYISQHKLGYPITELEESASNECGRVKFYYIKNFGLIELNMPN